MKRLGTFILLLMLIGCATFGIEDRSGFDIVFKNDTDKLRCYRLLWHDHGFKDFWRPVAMCGGEVKPGNEIEVNNGYPVGVWEINWYDCRSGDWEVTRSLAITKDTRKIITTPMEDILK